MRRTALTLALAFAAALVASPASASLVWTSNVHVTGTGFGSVPRDLTIQATGQNKTNSESGCVGVVATATISIGPSACLATETGVHDPNGVINHGGDEPPPHADNQKYGIPTVGSLGWGSAADIAIMFDATDPGGNGLTLTDLTLKFYNAAGTLLGAIDGNQVFTHTDVGNGGSGKVFTVSTTPGDNEQAFLNSLIFNGQDLSNVYVSLEATITDATGGPESFVIFNRRTPPVPEPATWAMMLLGFGGIGMAMRRRRKNARLAQIA